jgi:hypothetical protein
VSERREEKRTLIRRTIAASLKHGIIFFKDTKPFVRDFLKKKKKISGPW